MATRVRGNLALFLVPATDVAKVGEAGEVVELEGDLSKALEGEKVALEAEKTTELEQSFAQAARESEQAGIAIEDAKRAERVEKGTEKVKNSAEIARPTFEITDSIREALTTKEDKAYFWSGLGEYGAQIAKKTALNKECTTLENQTEINRNNMPERSFFDKKSQQTWRDVSLCYAQSCSWKYKCCVRK